jgi:hydroxyacid-oxoacid transhydrogenase
LASLQSQSDLPFEVFDQVVAEPTEDSWKSAISWARKHDFSHFLAYVLFLVSFMLTSYVIHDSIGGGSVIDTAKAANLYNYVFFAETTSNVPASLDLPYTRMRI